MSKTPTGKKQYRSMRGKIVDLDLLRKKNELTPAVGNAKVNARGDELGPGGKIIRKREDIVRDYYEQNPNAVKDESGRFTTPAARTNTATTSADKLTAAEAELEKELADEDDWVEDVDGNFVQKGK